MLELVLEPVEVYDDATGSFQIVESPVHKIRLEHSLVSVSKWESIHAKPFLSKKDKTPEEIFSYIRCMVLDEDVDEQILVRLSRRQLNEVLAYIESSQSATTFGNMPKRTGPEEIVTSELVYYWMITFSIPFDCESWHLNRLFSLIRICNLKNQKPTKMTKSEMASRNRELNERRRQELKSRG